MGGEGSGPDLFVDEESRARHCAEGWGNGKSWERDCFFATQTIKAR